LNTTKSCGCLEIENQFKPKNITNKKFGRLTALKPTQERDNNGCVIWECRCECGNSSYVSSGDLINGKTKSCGCEKVGASKNNIKKATKVHLEKNIVQNTNIPAITSKKLLSNNTSDVTGVTWDKSRNMWVAQIQFQKEYYFLGRRKNKDEAIQLRKEAEEKYFKPVLDKFNKERK
jgi:hypothetical protein